MSPCCPLDGEGITIPPETEVVNMQEKVRTAGLYDPDFEEELIGILNAISIVAKRLAKKLAAMERQRELAQEGGGHAT